MSKTLFSAADGTHGSELWITDGTAAGTSLLKEINPTPSGDATPAGFVALGTKVLFRAFDGTHGSELWITDGTADGTSMLQDINSGGSSLPTGLIALGDKVIFNADDGTHGVELWVTDGTTGGTSMLQDIDAGATGSSPFSVVVASGNALFFANDGTHGKELWITDGSTGGTSLIKDINPGSANSRSYFPGGAEFKGQFFFQAREGGFNYELWVTDGSAAGTSLFKDIRSGSDAASDPKYLTVLGDRLLFDANDGIHGIELWVSDGTGAGTSLLLDIQPGNLSGAPHEFTVLGDKMLFTAGDGTHGLELWATDGTTAGTSLLKDINPGASQSAPGHLTILGSQVLFSASDGTTGYEPWITDGTAAGTSLLKDVNPDAGNSFPFGFTATGTTAVFSANDGTHGPEIWITDGTAAGTSLVKDINPGTPSSGVSNFFSAPNLVACFRQGTRIRTTTGDVPVEALRIGDRVVSAFGGTVPVRWIGLRRIDCARHPRRWDVDPIRIHAGAFGPAMPCRDLWLSPDHAVHADGALVPARALVNGRTIVQDRTAVVIYYHVELPAHDVLLAENLPCESYLDTGNRAAFANAGVVQQLHPDFARVHAESVWASQACANLVTAGPRLAAVQAGLLRRASELGHALTEAPALRLFADGRRLSPAIDGRGWRVQLPAGAGRLRLVSRRFVPAETQPASNDTRSLGVALAQLRLDDRPLWLDDPRLGAGWAAPEAEWRWTEGDACLAVDGACSLAFDLAMTGAYWLLPRPARTAAAG